MTTTGRGRPPIGPIIKVALDPDTLNQIDQLATHHDIPRAAMIRQLLHQALHSPQ